MRTGQRVKTLT